VSSCVHTQGCVVHNTRAVMYNDVSNLHIHSIYPHTDIVLLFIHSNFLIILLNRNSWIFHIIG